MDTPTQSECARAIHELQAQRSALDRVRASVMRIAGGGVQQIIPLSWSSPSSRAFTLRIDDVAADIGVCESTLSAAIAATERDIAQVRADTPTRMDTTSFGGDR